MEAFELTAYECEQGQRKRLLRWFHKIAQSGVNIFLTSRNHVEDFRDSLQNSAKVELRARNEDLAQYIEKKLEDYPRANLLITRGDCMERVVSDTRNMLYLFLDYAARYLTTHLKSCDESLSTAPFLEFLARPGCLSSYAQAKTGYFRDPILQLGCQKFENDHFPYYITNQYPLHIAAASRHRKVVRLLLDTGAAVCAKNAVRRTALHEAVESGNCEAARLLLEGDTDISARRVRRKQRYILRLVMGTRG